ncbi:MAG: hypothetical protein KDI75_10375 [Xanthomonadales bacterium]|nr:hypothetical protein [Xanthomonadales bacterium]
MTSPLLPALVCLSLSLGAVPATATDRDASQPLRPVSQCLRTNQVSDWKVINDRHLLVKALGNRYYDIRLSNRCVRLTSSTYIGFRDGVQPLMVPGRPAGHAAGQNPTTTDDRICGDIGDAVLPRNGASDDAQPPCDIATIRRVDKETWKSAKKLSR